MRWQSHQGENICDISMASLVAHWPVFWPVFDLRICSWTVNPIERSLLNLIFLSQQQEKALNIEHRTSALRVLALGYKQLGNLHGRSNMVIPEWGLDALITKHRQCFVKEATQALIHCTHYRLMRCTYYMVIHCTHCRPICCTHYRLIHYALQADALYTLQADTL